MATDMLVASSTFPVRLMFIASALLGLIAIALAVVFGATWLRGGGPPEPWGLAAWGVLTLAALNFLMLSVLGEYLWRVLEEVRGRPLYIIDEVLGFAAGVPEHEAVEVTTRPT
jgi:dolichol-phosphate mannosyltransferase